MSTVHRSLRNLTLLMLIGLFLRIAVSQLFLGGLNREYQGDEADYVKEASHIIDGLGFTDSSGKPTSYRAPGLPLLITVPVSLRGPDIVAIRMFMCIIESLLAPALYLLVRAVSGSTSVALVAGTLAMFFPTWIFPAGAVMTDIPAAILVTLMAWMLIEGQRRTRWLWIFGAGILWAIATVTRAGSLIYGSSIVLWLLLMMPDWKTRATAVFMVTVPFVLILAPWSIRNTYVHGTFVPLTTQGGIQLYIANNPDATGILAIDQSHVDRTSRVERYPKEQYPSEGVRDKLFQKDAINFIRENPWRFAELCLIHLGQFWKLYSPRVSLLSSLGVIASFGVTLPFFFIQVVRRGWRRGPELLLVLIILSHMTLHMVYGAIVRYRIPVEPLLIAVAIGGFFWAFAHLESSRGTFALKASNRARKYPV